MPQEPDLPNWLNIIANTSFFTGYLFFMVYAVLLKDIRRFARRFWGFPAYALTGAANIVTAMILIEAGLCFEGWLQAGFQFLLGAGLVLVWLLIFCAEIPRARRHIR